MRLVGIRIPFLIGSLLVGLLPLWAQTSAPSPEGMAYGDTTVDAINFNWIESFGTGSTLLSTAPDNDTVYTVTMPPGFTFNYYGTD